MAATRFPAQLLAERVRTAGSRPLLTYYDPAAGERTEFTATSFANWVNKTANLLDTLGVDPGLVAAPLSVTHPGHWVSLIWPLATWQTGSAYAAVLPPLPPTAGAAVIGPDEPTELIADATIACSLHPLGHPLHGLPDGVLDYSTYALAEPDGHYAATVRPTDPAWFDFDEEFTHADVAALPPLSGRVLVRPSTPWRTLADALLRPLLGGGSTVIVAGEVDDARLERIATSERVTTLATDG